MSDLLSVPFGDLRLDYATRRAEVDAAIARVLQSGWFVLGKAGEQFEREFAGYCGVPHAVGVGSGTEALHLSLLACGVIPGDEVITVANTCVPTLSAVTFANASPVLVDIDPDTQTMDPSQIERRITSRTRVIMPVQLYGQCADMDPILDIAKRHGLKVVEDCAQAHGARDKGRLAGTMGDAGCFSFYPSKNLGAYGDGGMVVCRDSEMADRLRMLRNYGQRKRYYHSIKGFNSRLDEMQAAILSAKLPHLDHANARRRAIAARYTQALSGLSGITPPTEAAGRFHVFHLYVVRVAKREQLQTWLQQRGIGTMIHYPVPIHRQDSYAECARQEQHLETTDEQADQILSLPIYPELTDQQVDAVISAIRTWANA